MWGVDALTGNDTLFWAATGLVGQGAFFCRFLVQWVASERARQSYIPLSFWYLSLVGSLILLVYAIHRGEPIFLLGQLPNGFVYLRNIMLIRHGGVEQGLSGAALPVDGPAGGAGG